MGEAAEVVQRFYSCFNAGDRAGSDACLAPDSVIVSPSGTKTKAEYVEDGSAFATAFPDACFNITRLLESGNGVYVSGRFMATHTGDLHTPGGTIQARGAHVDFPFVDYFEIEDGLITRHEGMFEQAVFRAQMSS